ncbi:MAG: hypothetical protein R3232_11730, partial [Clostridia bacterium]|nr:hypothetical protein [Clostridia bacterium]
MIIISVNPARKHYERVKKDVIKHGEVTLKGYRVRNVILLLEGSHRMAVAADLKYPITINIL